MAQRVTQLGAEVVVKLRSSLRVTQLGAEVLVSPKKAVRVTQLGAEVLVSLQKAVRVTQLGAEVILASPGASPQPSVFERAVTAAWKQPLYDLEIPDLGIHILSFIPAVAGVAVGIGYGTSYGVAYGTE